MANELNNMFPYDIDLSVAISKIIPAPSDLGKLLNIKYTYNKMSRSNKSSI